MRGRAVAAWSAACLLIVLLSTNPAYRLLVLVIAAFAVVAGAGPGRVRPLLAATGAAGLVAAALNFGLSHVGGDVLFELPASWPAVGGRYTLEALVYGVLTGVTLAAAVVAVAPLSLLLEPHELVEALPSWLARTGAVVSASLNLVPALARSFAAVAEAQRLRGWRPRGPRSWAEVAVPVVLTAIEDSIQLAEAMEARGFGSGPRTRFETARWSRPDAAVAAAAAAAGLAFTAARLTGGAADWYPYPFLQPPAVSPLALGACLLLLAGPLAWRSPSSPR